MPIAHQIQQGLRGPSYGIVLGPQLGEFLHVDGGTGGHPRRRQRGVREERGDAASQCGGALPGGLEPGELVCLLRGYFLDDGGSELRAGLSKRVASRAPAVRNAEGGDRRSIDRGCRGGSPRLMASGLRPPRHL